MLQDRTLTEQGAQGGGLMASDVSVYETVAKAEEGRTLDPCCRPDVESKTDI